MQRSTILVAVAIVLVVFLLYRNKTKSPQVVKSGPFTEPRGVDGQSSSWIT